MTTLIAAVVSMLALTGLAWLASRAVPRLAICPICVGVSATWLGLLAARFAGIALDDTVIAVLLGVSVLGIVEWRAERLPAGRSPLLWKALAIPLGVVAVYALVKDAWLVAGASALGFALLAWLVRLPRRAHEASPEAVSQLEERMKRCC